MANYLDGVRAQLLGSVSTFRQSVRDQAKQKTFSLKQPGPLIQWAADLLGTNKSGTTKPYGQSIWVYRAIRLWQRLAQVPMLLKNADGEPIEDGAVAYLINHPSSRMTQEQFSEWLILSLAHRGEYFVLKDDGRKETDTPTFLTVVMPDRMSLQDGDVLDSGMVRQWTMAMGRGKSMKVPAGAVIHDMFPNPYDPCRGIGPLDAARLSVDADYAARLHNKYMMERHGRISHLVSFKQDVGPDSLKVYADKWRENYEGNENAGKMAFLDNDASVAQLALSSKDLDWLEGQKLSREEICAAFGIPPPVAGVLDKATYENITQANKMLWTECLIPIGNRIASMLTRRLVEPQMMGAYVEFDYMNHVPALQEEEGLRVDRYIKLVQGKVTPERAAEMTQLDIGDDPAHEVVWVQASEMPASFALEPPDAMPPEPQPKPPGAVTDPSEDPNDTTEDDTEDQPEPKAMSKERNEVRQAKGRTMLREAGVWERRLLPALKKFFWDQRVTVMENAQAIDAELKAYVGVRKANELYAKTAQEITDKLLGGKAWDKELLAKVGPILREAGKSGALRILTQISRPVNTFHDGILDSYVRDQATLLQEVNATTRIALQKASGTMLDAVNKGESVSTIMESFRDDLRGVFNNTEARRRTIARTESLRAYNGGQHAMMQDADIEKQEWLTIGDGDVRDSHQAIDGEVVSINDTFSNRLRYPGDPLGAPGETINCRCSLLPVIT